jgi:tRNA pseudouridine55 synthase
MITKQEINLTNYNFDQGDLLLLDKPLGWSSFKVVYKVKQALHIKKVGHSGTLDPLATGLLILATGKKTKELTQFLLMDKTYTGTFLLGKRTASMDAETEVILERPTENITEEDILKTKDSFLGVIFQVPPMHSAISVDGKKLYEHAREGVEIKRSARPITIYDFKITKIEMPEVHFEIRCSKGTYIRVIANDFGEKLGCGAYLSNLRRTKVGYFSVDDAFAAEDFIKMASAAFAGKKKAAAKKKKFDSKQKFKSKPKLKNGNKIEKKFKPKSNMKLKLRPKAKFRKNTNHRNSDKKF